MQYTQHKKAKQIIKEIALNRKNYLIIHYSCESFYNTKDGHTPRITSIAVYQLESAQTDSFSIHKSAEKNHIDFDKIDENYDKLERLMLTDFYKFIKEHKSYTWLHWNMRDINYGFKAIEHRYEVLGRKPIILEDSHKIDLARLLIQCYGINYANHPRIENILQLNKIKAKDYLPGKDEAIAFKRKDYVSLHRSTLRKVDVFANIINKSIQGTLKVNSKVIDIYGLSIQGLFEYSSSTWWLTMFWSILMLFIGGYVGSLF